MNNPVINVNPQKVGNNKEMSERDVFSTVLIHCLFIILSPIITFFISTRVFTSFGLESMNSNIYSAFSAVIVLHIALGNLIYRAYLKTEDTIPGFDKLHMEKED